MKNSRLRYNSRLFENKFANFHLTGKKEKENKFANNSKDT